MYKKHRQEDFNMFGNPFLRIIEDYSLEEKQTQTQEEKICPQFLEENKSFWQKHFWNNKSQDNDPNAKRKDLRRSLFLRRKNYSKRKICRCSKCCYTSALLTTALIITGICIWILTPEERSKYRF